MGYRHFGPVVARAHRLARQLRGGKNRGRPHRSPTRLPAPDYRKEPKPARRRNRSGNRKHSVERQAARHSEACNLHKLQAVEAHNRNFARRRRIFGQRNRPALADRLVFENDSLRRRGVHGFGNRDFVDFGVADVEAAENSAPRGAAPLAREHGGGGVRTCRLPRQGRRENRRVRQPDSRNLRHDNRAFRFDKIDTRRRRIRSRRRGADFGACAVARINLAFGGGVDEARRGDGEIDFVFGGRNQQGGAFVGGAGAQNARQQSRRRRQPAASKTPRRKTSPKGSR